MVNKPSIAGWNLKRSLCEHVNSGRRMLTRHKLKCVELSRSTVTVCAQKYCKTVQENLDQNLWNNFPNKTSVGKQQISAVQNTTHKPRGQERCETSPNRDYDDNALRFRNAKQRSLESGRHQHGYHVAILLAPAAQIVRILNSMCEYHNKSWMQDHIVAHLQKWFCYWKTCEMYRIMTTSWMPRKRNC